MNNKFMFSAILSIAVFPEAQGADKQADTSRPNILWITLEDTSPQFIGCYGNKNARTPVIDKLAKEGVRFTNAFSTGTVCSPSRTAIITGVKTYMTGTGHHRSKYPLPDYIKGFPYYLQQEGYYTTNNAKTDYNVAEEEEFIREAWNESSGKAGWWNRKPGQPFFAVFNFMESHQSRTMTEPYDWYEKNILEELPADSRIGDNEFDLPPFYFDSPAMRKQFARVYNSIALTDIKIGELLKHLERDNLKDSTIIFIFADHGEGMPRGKTNGINYGYRVPFIVWVPPMYEHLSPWGTGNKITEKLVDFTDLAPTLISLAGGDIPRHMQGRPFLGSLRKEPVKHLVLSSDRSDNGIDMVRTVTDGRFVYSRNFMPFINETRYIRYMEIGEIKQQMRQNLAEEKLNPLQKSLFDERPAEFLFDIENDLWETNNLAMNPEYNAVLRKMQNLLKEEIIRSRDVMFLPEYEINLVSSFASAYEYRLNNEYYPVETICDAASMAGFRDKKLAAEQIKLLASDDEVIRYWAALGLRSQPALYLKPFRAALIKAMQDEYPPVAVTASAIVYDLFEDATAENKLKGFCASENLQISLMAINYLLYINNREPFAGTIREVHGMADRDYNVRAACMDFLGNLGLVPNTPQYRE